MYIYIYIYLYIFASMWSGVDVLVWIFVTMEYWWSIGIFDLLQALQAHVS